MILESFAIILLTYLVAGTLPPVVAHYLFGTRFLGGIAAALLVGVIGAVCGGLAHTVAAIPDVLVIGGTVEIVWPLLASIGLTAIFALVSAR